MICIIVKTGYVMKKNAVATDVTYLLVRVHQTPPNDPSMTGIHFMECQMLSLNAVRTQWVHVNLGLVRVQQDLRNDTSMICISVKTGYVMKKNAVATDVTYLLVRVHQTTRACAFYGMSNAESECCQNTMGTCQSWAGTCPAGSEKRHEHDSHR